VRNSGILLRLALGEADLHSVAFELQPAAVGIDVGLFETQLARIEGAAGLEVADLVPDGSQRASPGSSRKVFRSRRNSAPVAPSTAR
jgi:hypothetical protein